MDKKRLRELGGGQKAPDKVRLFVLVVLLILVFGLFFYAQQQPKTVVDLPRESSFQPKSDSNDPPASDVNPALLEPVEDASLAERVTLESEPLLHLLMESGKTVPGDFSRMDTKVLDEARYQELLENPDKFRGEPYIAKGLFLFSEPRKVKLTGGSEWMTYYSGLLEDDQGHQVSFSVLEQPADFSQGDIAKIEGFFLKRHAIFSPENPDEAIDQTVHLVGKKLDHSVFRMDPVEVLDLALMSTVRDYELSEQEHIEEDVLYHGLSFLQNVDAETFSALAEDRTSFQLRSNPEQYRGNPVRVLGTFFRTFRQELGIDGENPLELPFVYHGLLVHSGPSFTYLISLEKEPEWVKPDTNVIAEGIFVKRYTYVAKNGVPVTCPLILVKNFEPFQVDTSAFQNEFSIGFIVVALILLGWFFVSLVGDRKAAREYRRRYYAQRRTQVKERLGHLSKKS